MYTTTEILLSLGLVLISTTILISVTYITIIYLGMISATIEFAILSFLVTWIIIKPLGRLFIWMNYKPGVKFMIWLKTKMKIIINV